MCGSRREASKQVSGQAPLRPVHEHNPLVPRAGKTPLGPRQRVKRDNGHMRSRRTPNATKQHDEASRWSPSSAQCPCGGSLSSVGFAVILSSCSNRADHFDWLWLGCFSSRSICFSCLVTSRYHQTSCTCPASEGGSVYVKHPLLLLTRPPPSPLCHRLINLNQSIHHPQSQHRQYEAHARGVPPPGPALHDPLPGPPLAPTPQRSSTRTPCPPPPDYCDYSPWRRRQDSSTTTSKRRRTTARKRQGR